MIDISDFEELEDLTRESEFLDRFARRAKRSNHHPDVKEHSGRRIRNENRMKREFGVV